MKQEFFHSARTYSLAAIALLMPVTLTISSMLILIPGALLLAGIFIPGISFRKEDVKWFLLSISLYLMIAISMLWSADKSEGGFNLQVKMPLIIYPLLFLQGNRLDRKGILIIMFSFVIGCIAAMFICFIAGYRDYRITGNISEFFYSELSRYMHPSYMAMYIIFAMLFLALMLGQLRNKILLIAITVLLIKFTFFIAMLQSKAGIISAMILLPAAAGYAGWRSKRWLLMVVMLAACYLTYDLTGRYVITNANSRMFNAEYNITHLEEVHKTGNGAETSEVRVQIWKTAAGILKSDWMTGVGVGDVKSTLVSAYKERGMEFAFEHTLNAHDQFLQVWLGCGVAGLLSILLIFLLPGWNALRRRDVFMLLFLMLAGLNFLFESMLEARAGTLFFGFFASFFLLLYTDFLSSDTDKNV